MATPCLYVFWPHYIHVHMYGGTNVCIAAFLTVSLQALELDMDSSILIFLMDGDSCPELTIVQLIFGDHLWTLVELVKWLVSPFSFYCM